MIRKHLKTVFRNTSKGYISIVGIAGDEKCYYIFNVGDTDSILETVQNLVQKGFNVYFTPNIMGNPPISGRGKEDTISKVTSIVLDIDIEGGSHNGSNYPPNKETAISLLPLEPTMIIDTGYGIQVYYIFDKPYQVDEYSKNRYESYISKVTHIAKEKGYINGVDNVASLNHIFRLAGTFNYKSNDKVECKILSITDKFYTPEDFPATFNSKHSTFAKFFLETVPAETLNYANWRNVVWICHSLGLDEEVTNWSKKDTIRYSEKELLNLINDYKSNKGLTVCTLNYYLSNYYSNQREIAKTWFNSVKITIDVLEDSNTYVYLNLLGDKYIKRFLQLIKVSKLKYSDSDILYKINVAKPVIPNISKPTEEDLKDLLDYNQPSDLVIHELMALLECKYDNNILTSVKSTANNARLIVSYDPVLHDLVGFNTFTNTETLIRDWELYKEGTSVSEEVFSSILMYIAKTYKNFSSDKWIRYAIKAHSQNYRFNPIKRFFFDTLPKWDNIPRADSILIKFLGAQDSQYTRIITANWLLGAVSRALNPGCDYQITLVLPGAQRIGKSKLMRMLGGKEGVCSYDNWHISLIDSLEDSHAIDAINAGWIIEIEEFKAGKKASSQAIKAFLSANDDTRRFAYDKTASTYLRHCVFAVTCNEENFLTDTTGNARFAIVPCTQEMFKQVDGMTPEYIRQVWAEVLVWYSNMFPNGFIEGKLQLPYEIRIQLEQVSSKYMNYKETIGLIQAFLDIPILEEPIWNTLSRFERRKYISQGFLLRGTTPLYGATKRIHISGIEVLVECFGIDRDKKLLDEIYYCLDNLTSWTKGKRIQKDFAYGDMKKVYYRE